MPVHYGRQVYEAALEPDVGDVGAPDLVYPVNADIAQQVWVLLMLLVRNRQFLLRVDGFDVQHIHCPSDRVPSCFNAKFVAQGMDHAPLATGGIIRVQFVHAIK